MKIQRFKTSEAFCAFKPDNRCNHVVFVSKYTYWVWIGSRFAGEIERLRSDLFPNTLWRAQFSRKNTRSAPKRTIEDCVAWLRRNAKLGAKETP